MSRAVDGLGLAGNFQANGNTKQDPLCASALFRSEGARQSRLHGIGRVLPGSDRRFHSSIPQKSMSGATSSIPYSQPSGRGFPFHTTTEALLVPVAKLVSDRR